MIVVTVDMWPRGNESRQYRLGRMFIWNVGGTDRRGDYRVAVRRKGCEELHPVEHPASKATRIGEVNGHARRSYNFWTLVLKALRSAFPEIKLG